MKGLVIVILMLAASISAETGFHEIKLRDGRVYASAKLLKASGSHAELYVVGAGWIKTPLNNLFEKEKAEADKLIADAAARQAEEQRKAKEAPQQAEKLKQERMRGVKTHVITTKKGKNFTDVFAWEVQGDRVKLSMVEGAATIPLSDLTVDSLKLVTAPK